jgi:hypothetical protein
MEFIHRYLQYSESNEAPQEYHRWAALSCLSHLIGPRVHTHMGGFLSFYPNLYIMLVGEPGTMKTTAMLQAKELLDHFPKIAHSPASASKEAVVKLMADDESPCRGKFQWTDGKSVEYSQLALFASEIISLLNASGNPSGMIEFLTDVWDRSGRNYEQSFIKGKTIIKRPFVSILACLTPSTLQQLVNTKVVSTGMSRRCVFDTFNGVITNPRSFIEVTEEQQKAWAWCIEHGKKLSNISGAFDWTPEAKAFYSAWYNSFKPTISSVKSEILRNFYMTKPEYVIKLSMLLSLAKSTPSLVHEVELFETALKLVTSVEQGAVDLFDSAGRNELAPVASWLEKFMKARPGQKFTFSELLRESWSQIKNGDRRELESILEHLGMSGKIRKIEESYKDEHGNFQLKTVFTYVIE